MLRTNKRPIILIGLVIVVVLALIAGACGKAEPATTTAPTTTAPTTTAPTTTVPPWTGEVIKLRFMRIWPTGNPLYPVEVWHAEQLEERTGGRVQVEISEPLAWGTTLEGWPMLRAGAVDLLEWNAAYTPGELPFQALDQSAVGLLGGNAETVRVGEELYFHSGAVSEIIQAESRKQNAVVLYTQPGAEYFLLANKPIRNLADAQGVKARTFGEWQPKLAVAVGLTPVTVSTGELYEAYQRGVVDAVPFALYYHTGFGFQDIGGYLTGMHLGGIIAGPTYMNLAKWNSLPAEVQQVFTDVRPDTYVFALETGNRLIQEAVDKFNAAGKTTWVEFPASEQEKVYQAALEVVIPGFIAKMKGIGLEWEAKAYTTRFVELIDAYRAGSL